MARTIFGEALIQQFLAPISVTSDGATSSYIDYNGYNAALIICSGGTVGTGDSDDTVAFQVSRIDDIAAASAAASDHVAITAATTTLGASADTDTALGVEMIYLDFTEHTLDNGCLVVVATASEGGAAVCSADIILLGGSGTHTDTSMTIVRATSS